MVLNMCIWADLESLWDYLCSLKSIHFTFMRPFVQLDFHFHIQMFIVEVNCFRNTMEIHACVCLCVWLCVCNYSSACAWVSVNLIEYFFVYCCVWGQRLPWKKSLHVLPNTAEEPELLDVLRSHKKFRFSSFFSWRTRASQGLFGCPTNTDF